MQIFGLVAFLEQKKMITMTICLCYRFCFSVKATRPKIYKNNVCFYFKNILQQKLISSKEGLCVDMYVAGIDITYSLDIIYEVLSGNYL